MSISNVYRRFSLLLLLAIALFLRLQSMYPFLVVDEDTILTMVWGLHLDPLPTGMHAPARLSAPFYLP